MYLALGSGLPGFPLDSTCPAVLRCLVNASSHVYGAVTRSGRLSHAVPLQPPRLPRDPTTPPRKVVWAPPLSLATTRGILSFPRAIEMFQFTRFPRLAAYRVMTRGGFPHSDISGSNAHTRLTGTFRSVSRPSSALDAQASPVCSYSLLHM